VNEPQLAGRLEDDPRDENGSSRASPGPTAFTCPARRVADSLLACVAWLLVAAGHGFGGGYEAHATDGQRAGDLSWTSGPHFASPSVLYGPETYGGTPAQGLIRDRNWNASAARVLRNSTVAMPYVPVEEPVKKRSAAELPRDEQPWSPYRPWVLPAEVFLPVETAMRTVYPVPPQPMPAGANSMRRLPPVTAQ
jgi:hypothetical protein